MNGHGPRFLRLGNGPSGRVYYREEDVLRWLAEQPTFASTIEEKQYLAGCRGVNADKTPYVPPNPNATPGDDIRNPPGR